MAGLVLNIGANTNQANTEIKKFGFTVAELKVQVKSLEGELANLDRKMLSTSGGRALAGELRLAKAELKSLESQAAISGAATNNAFSKAFGSVRQLAYILPGIGIAGIFNLAFEGIGKLISGTKELSEEEKRLQDIRKESLADLGKERSQVDQLVLLLRSENTTKSEKVEILKKLKDIAPQYFADLRTEGGLIDNLNIAYDKYLKSLVARSEAMVLSKQLDDLSAKILDFESKGATVGIFSPTLGRDLQGNLQITKRLTDEQVKQNLLNLPYNQLLKERQSILDGLLQRQSALTDNLDLGGDLTTPADQTGKIIARAKALAGELKNIFIVPNFSAADSKGDSLAKAQKFLDDYFGARLIVRLSPKIRIEDVEFPPGEFKQTVTQFGDLFKGEIDNYFRTNQLLDVSLVRAVMNASTPAAIAAQNLGRDTANAFNEGMQVALTDSFTAIGEGLGSALSGGSLMDGFKGFAMAIGNGLQAIGKQIISIGIAALLAKESLKKLFTNPFIAIAAGIGLVAAGAALKNVLSRGLSGRAAGGPVAANNPYVVGEIGQEIFVPSTSGRIIPNNQLGGVMGQAAQLIRVMVTGEVSGRNIKLVTAREDRYQGANV